MGKDRQRFGELPEDSGAKAASGDPDQLGALY